MFRNVKIIFIGIALFALPFAVNAEYVGQITKFFVNSSYDASQREEVSASLLKISSQLKFYIDDEWWRKQNPFQQAETRRAVDSLAREFEGKIYPSLTATFGSEWKPGIDNDARITILIHPMKEKMGGYFNSGDEYSKLQNPESNEREMIYLNSDFITNSSAKSLLAHEFTHLITFNQKEKKQKVSGEVWLNEARAEYAPTLLGYDDIYKGSNLEQRVRDFISKPSDSLTEWDGKKQDYAGINLFTQYLVDQYGLRILQDSLHSNKVGIASINEAMEKNGFTATFADIFTDWTIAVLINNCDFGERYCYKNSNLKNFKIVPQTNFLPLSGKSTLSFAGNAKDWTGTWYRIVGGNNVLKIEFQGNPRANFKMPYIIKDQSGDINLQFLEFDNNQKGIVYVQNFNSKNKSVILIPSPQTDGITGGNFPIYQFVLTLSTVPRTPEQDDIFIEKLKAQIEFLQKEIIRVQSQIAAILAKKEQEVSCGSFSQNLYIGMRDNAAVRCLQIFLKSQGDDIYPQGLITGYFGPLTKAAIIRFQEKYANEILKPIGLERGTGIFGPATRTEVNRILESGR